jgi:hypothetical protein
MGDTIKADPNQRLALPAKFIQHLLPFLIKMRLRVWLDVSLLQKPIKTQMI